MVLRKTLHRNVRRRWWVFFLVPLLLVGGFVGWTLDVSRPLPEALAALQSDGQVRVDQGRWLVFAPVARKPKTGLIFYPGGKVDPRAYAGPARSIASQGYLVAVVPMPLNLAVLAPNRASDVIAAYPDVHQWAIGGHSLGGAMAARFAHQQPSLVDGLVLWAAYSSDDLTQHALPVVSIYGTQDGVATEARVMASRSLLPVATRWVPLTGGNHAQFGSYGPQAGDNPAAITRSAQQAEAVAATVAFLAALKP